MAVPPVVPPGGKVTLTATVTGGVGPYTFASGEPGLCQASSTQTVLRVDVSPAASSQYTVEVADSRGQKQSASAAVKVQAGAALPPGVIGGDGVAVTPTGNGDGHGDVPVVVTPPPANQVTAEGPLAQALTELWEKARKEKFDRLERLVVKFYEAAAAFKVHQAMATLKDAQVCCRFEASMEADGVEAFRVEFAGKVEKANAVKSFLDPQIRAAKDSHFEAVYTVEFDKGLAMGGPDPETLAKGLTRYGAGEAFVEAHAATAEVAA